MDQNNSKDVHIKLIHFGSSLKWSAKDTLKTVAGSALFMAPEILDDEGRTDFECSADCDLWSCGILMYILLTGLPPFEGVNNDELIEMIKRVPISFEVPAFKYVSEDGKELCQKLLSPNPAERLTSKEILNHPWFERFHTINKAVNINPQSIELMKNLRDFNSRVRLQQACLSFIQINLVTNQEEQ